MSAKIQFKAETVLVEEFVFASKMQQSKAAALKAERILKTGYKTRLPQYVIDAANAAGYAVKSIGWTTGKSSTWAFFKK